MYVLVWLCGLVWKSPCRCPGRAMAPPDEHATVGRDTLVQTCLEQPRPLSATASRPHSRLRNEPTPTEFMALSRLVLWPHTNRARSPRRSPGLVQMNSWRPPRKFRDNVVPGGAQGLAQAALRPLWPLLHLRHRLLPPIPCSCPGKPSVLVSDEHFRARCWM